MFLFVYPHQIIQNVPAGVMQRPVPEEYLSWDEARAMHKRGVPVAHISDVVRLQVAVHEGGVVFDIDSWWLRPSPCSPFVATLYEKVTGMGNKERSKATRQRWDAFARPGWDGVGLVNTPFGVLPLPHRFASRLQQFVHRFKDTYTSAAHTVVFDEDRDRNVLMHGVRDIILDLGMGSVVRPPIEFGAALSDEQHRTDVVRDSKYASARVLNGTAVADQAEVLAGAVAVPTSFALAARHGDQPSVPNSRLSLVEERPHSLLAALLPYVESGMAGRSLPERPPSPPQSPPASRPPSPPPASAELQLHHSGLPCHQSMPSPPPSPPPSAPALLANLCAATMFTACRRAFRCFQEWADGILRRNPVLIEHGLEQDGLEQGVPNAEIHEAVRQLSEFASDQWCVDNLQAARGIDGMLERSWCSEQWQHHFNVGGAANGSFRVLDETHAELAVLVGRVSTLAMQSMPLVLQAGFTPSELDWRAVQFSRGFGRGLHVDGDHLGDLILSVTLRGDCQIVVEHPASSRRPAQFAQRAGDFYAIWGASRESPNRHAVKAGTMPRTSVTLRYVKGSVPPSLRATRFTWQRGEACVVQSGSGGEQHCGKVLKAYHSEERCIVHLEDARERIVDVPFARMRLPDEPPRDRAHAAAQQRAERLERRRNQLHG